MDVLLIAAHASLTLLSTRSMAVRTRSNMMLLFLCVLHSSAVFSRAAAGCGSSRFTPRMTFKEDGFSRHHLLGGYNSRVELLLGPTNGTVYVGCNGKLLLVDFQAPKKSEEVTWGHNVTVLLKNENTNSLFVCGTSGSQICCSMETLGNCSKHYDAKGIAPFSVNERAPSLFVGGELYSTATLPVRKRIGIRRHGGIQIWPAHNKTEQRYVSIVLSGPRAHKLEDRVYAFLVEKNSDSHPDASLWIPRVTQVCRMDLGGSKNILQQSWTSHLTARLSCGIHEKRVYFTELLDVAVLHSEAWNESRVYALFTNDWNMSAVCVYTMGNIDKVFMSSTFKGHSEEIPTPRPGTCVNDSKMLPDIVLNMVKEQLEMNDWVQPVGDGDALIISSHRYTHIEVDRVKGSGLQVHTVLLLGLEDGRIHKVLEQTGIPFIMAELQLFQPGARLLNMLLQSSRKKLYVSSNTEVLEVDLDSCMNYGNECELCVQARDPYCGWDPESMLCTAASSHTIQDVEHGSYTACRTGGHSEQYSRLENPPLPPDTDLPVTYVRCPMLSAHAEYSWYRGDTRQPCVYTEGDCLLLIEAMDQGQDGPYMCKATEAGYERMIAVYQPKTWSKATCSARSHSGILCALLLIVLLL
ncbi:semaphorin-7A isoform X2 [Scleropages formosus]|uniref:Semaphorin-7A-like n=1 Tax=Scleropages formosus TaxID=113540 RepID=A0A8C9W7X1_SCLFO|nr:semaphorin-7A-like isoform X2 [Scleropages formosus]